VSRLRLLFDRSEDGLDPFVTSPVRSDLLEPWPDDSSRDLLPFDPSDRDLADPLEELSLETLESRDLLPIDRSERDLAEPLDELSRET